MTRLATPALLLALLLDFAGAPFAHTHALGTGDDHHAAIQTHLHGALHADDADGPAFDDIDPSDDVRATSWYQAAPQSGTPVWAPADVKAWPGLLDQAECIPAAPTARNHDPPSLCRLPARAPPNLPA